MIYLLGGIGIVIAVLLAALGFEHERVIYETNRAVAAELKVKEAQQRATDLALLWSAQVDKTEAASRLAQEQTNAQFAAITGRVKGLAGRCVAGSDVSKLLADIARAANAAGLATVGVPDTQAVPKSTGRPNR